MGYDLIPKKKGVDCKSGMIFTWPVILNETGACYLFGYGDHTFSPGNIFMSVPGKMAVR